MASQELFRKYLEGAGCGIEVFHDGKALTRIKIEFTGQAAHIPSLKNSKVIGNYVPFTNPKVMARLKVMDFVYFKALSHLGIRHLPSFGLQPVMMVLVCAKRKVAFDTDNCLTTVRDWLEPRSKLGGRGKHRGWGVGLVENDRQIRGFVFQDKDLGFKLDRSLLVVQRWTDCADKVSAFVNELAFDIMGAGACKLVN